MKRSAGRMFIRGFVKSIIVVAVLLSTGVLSYMAAMHFWPPKSEDAAIAYQNETVSEATGMTASETGIKGIVKNLICCYDEDTNEITKLVLEVFDGDNKQLTYVTIPVRTQLTLSDSTYKKIILDDPEIPQVLKLSTITKYLDSEKAFKDEVLMIEELIGTQISCYTAMPKSIYDTMFAQEDIEQPNNYDSVPMEIFSQEYKDYLKTLDTKKKLRAYIEETYPELQTNYPLEDRLSSLNIYYEASLNNVTFELVKGKNLNSSYEVNQDLASQQLEEITEDSVKKNIFTREEP